jgi:hypothetical protein
MVLDVAIGQCQRRNLTAPVNMGASDLGRLTWWWR